MIYNNDKEIGRCLDDAELISIEGMEREAWLKLRKSGIGGSEAGAIMGVSPFKSALEVYADKTSPDIENIDNVNMKLGRMLEPSIREDISNIFKGGFQVSKCPYMLRGRGRDSFRLADLDGVIIGRGHLEARSDITVIDSKGNIYSGEEGFEDVKTHIGESFSFGVLEIKTSKNGRGWGEERTELPPYYEMQVRHYMSMSSVFTYAIVVCFFIDTGKYSVFILNKDKEIEDRLIGVERKFWEDNVLKHTPPVSMGDDNDGAVLDKLISNMDVQYLPDDEKFSNLLMDYSNTKSYIDGYTSQLELIKDNIKEYILQHAVKSEEDKSIKIAYNDFNIDWRLIKGRRIDTNKLKKAKLYEEYSKEYTTRALFIKKGGKGDGE